MKKIGIINSEIAKLISELGHTDRIVIADSGLPIPSNVKRIDLALKQGVPGFLQTVETVLTEMQVEAAYIATEMQVVSPVVEGQIHHLLQDAAIRHVSHEQLKEMTKTAKAVIRTGEFTPYANVILQAGVVF